MNGQIRKIFYCLFFSIFSLIAQDHKKVMVKPAESDELSAILALDREVSFEYFKPIYLQYPERSIGRDPDRNLEEELAEDEKIFAESINSKNNKQLYVALLEQSIVGFVNFSQNAQSIIIDLLCVGKKHRGKGIGKEIVTKIFQIPDIISYRLAVIKKNEDAIKFWEKCGFTVLDEKPSDMGNYFPADCADIYRYYERVAKKD